MLHDTGCTEGKENHSERGYLFAKDYFKRKNIVLKNEELVLDAIKNHSDGFDTENIMTLALILADKLDIKSSRITEEGKKIKGNRQYQYIDDIVLKMNDNVLEVNFICNKNIDLDELFKAIDAFASKIKYDSKILINGEDIVSEEM